VIQPWAVATYNAREGWGMQKSKTRRQPTLSGRLLQLSPLGLRSLGESSSRRYRPEDNDSSSTQGQICSDLPCLLNRNATPRVALRQPHQIYKEINKSKPYAALGQRHRAHNLAPIYRQTSTRAKAAASTLSPCQSGTSSSTRHQIDQFQTLSNPLGLDLVAFTTHTPSSSPKASARWPRRNPALSYPGEEINVRVHTAHAAQASRKNWLAAALAAPGSKASRQTCRPTLRDSLYKLKVPADAQPTKPYFTRPTPSSLYDPPPAYRGRPSHLAPRALADLPTTASPSVSAR